jgi:hypothetical protein
MRAQMQNYCNKKGGTIFGGFDKTSNKCSTAHIRTVSQFLDTAACKASALPNFVSRIAWCAGLGC